MHPPVDLDDNRRSLTQEPRQKPLHDAMAPVWRAGEGNVLCTSRTSKLAQGSLDKLLGVRDEGAWLADLGHSGSDKMRLDALDVNTVRLELGTKRG